MLKIYTTLDEVEQEPSLIGYVRVLQRAWKEFNLSSVLCIDNVPTLYRVKETRILRPDELRDLHRRFWNQGVASVLLVVDAKSVYLFSGLQPPKRDDQTLFTAEDETLWLDALKLAAFSQVKEDELVQSIGNGSFYRQYSDKFKSSNSVDHYLSQNLHNLCRHLTKRAKNAPALDAITAHNFICRLLFACYLVDRGICPLPDTQEKRLCEALLSRGDEKAVDYLYAFFKTLKNKFNGSMFDQDLEAEKLLLTPSHMGQVKGFLQGDDLSSQQKTLGFWAYDFKLIPIETISGIYENFLTDDDKTNKGAYYTPRFLAEMAIDVATQGQGAWHTSSYFDPCCGSGVFLVTLFNRLATAWELQNRHLESDRDHYYECKNEALRNILRTQICGMDIKPAACILACFSLYVALLDSFDPSDIKTYIKKTGGTRLPKLLVREGVRNGKDNVIPVVYEGNSLTTKLFENSQFDIIIGNPPWGGEGGRGAKEQALRFLKRADDFMKPAGKTCLLLPSRIFLNIHSDSLQAEWLDAHTLERVVQLADFSFFLFPAALCPCMIVRFSKGTPADPLHEVLYDTPKFDAASRRQGLVLITEADRKNIPQAKLAYLAAKEQNQAHTLWKRHFWGTNRDQRFLDLLDTYPKLCDVAGLPNSKKRWTKGQGIIPDNFGKHPNGQNPWWKPDHLFISAKQECLNFGAFLFESDCVPIESRLSGLGRDRKANRSIFTPPVVLASQGFDKVVFCNFPVLFVSTLQAIHGPEEDSDLLLFLAAYLKSDLAKYYCFHISSMYGIERDVVRFDELLNLPFPLPKDSPARNAQQIVDKVALLFRSEKDRLDKLPSRKVDPASWLSARAESAKRLQTKTNALIYKYFDIQPEGRWLIEDTVNVFTPSSTPPNPDLTDLPTMLPITQASSVAAYAEGLKVYADVLAGTLNQWAEEQQSDTRVSARGGVDEASGLAFVRLEYGRKAASYKEVRFDSTVWKGLYKSFAEEQVAVRHERQLIGFLKDNAFYIVRPMSLMHWTRTAALNDADVFFGLEMRRQEGEE